MKNSTHGKCIDVIQSKHCVSRVLSGSILWLKYLMSFVHVARFALIPAQHKSKQSSTDLSHLCYLTQPLATQWLSDIDWSVEGQLFNTSEQQVLLSGCLFSCLSLCRPRMSLISSLLSFFRPGQIIRNLSQTPLAKEHFRKTLVF